MPGRLIQGFDKHVEWVLVTASPRRCIRAIHVVVAVLASSAQSIAEPTFFMGVDDGLLGQFLGTEARDVTSRASQYGLAIVGRRTLATGEEETIRWRPLEGTIGLGFLSKCVSSEANSVSVDGNIVVGHSTTSTSVKA